MTKHLEKENTYYCNFILWIIKTNLKLEKILKQNKLNSNQKEVLKITKISLENRFSKYLKYFNETPKYILALNPSTYQKLNNVQREDTNKSLYKTFSKKENKEIETNLNFNSSNIKIWDESSEIIENINFLDNYINKIQNWKLNDHEFWKFYQLDYSEIYNCFLLNNTFSISNGSVERKFSTIKYISDWRKNKIGTDKIKIKIMLKENEIIKEIGNKLFKE